ncbi:NADP-dependent oxidoreductase [soil metagenome]
MNRIVVATTFGGPEVLTIEETPTPAPGAGEVRVAVRAIGANPVDYKLYSGAFGSSPGLLRAFGSEASGVVDAVGEGVSDVAVGDEVVLPSIDGPGFADYLVAPASSVLPKPASLSFEEAAGLPVAAGTASHLIAATGLKAGETVLIHAAAGGVGSMAVQLAVIAGARVIGTASPRNHDFVRSLGGEPVEYGPGLLERVRALAPDGVDAAFDLVGSDEALDVSLAVVADPTRVATIVAFGRGSPAASRRSAADQVLTRARTFVRLVCGKR